MLSRTATTPSANGSPTSPPKWEIRSHRNMVGAHHDGSAVVVELDDGSEVSADAVLVATGRVPNGDQLDADTVGVEVADGLVVVDEYQRTTARGIFALGDVCSPISSSTSPTTRRGWSSTTCCRDWDDLDNLRPADHRYVPSAVFTDPQIACVGLSEKRGRAAGYDIRVKIQDYADVAYGWAMEDTTGFAKVIVEADTGKILGAHIMGHQASSLIQPLIQAMSFGWPARTARGQYWIHPALPGDRERAAGAVRGAAVAAVQAALGLSPRLARCASSGISGPGRRNPRAVPAGGRRAIPYRKAPRSRCRRPPPHRCPGRWPARTTGRHRADRGDDDHRGGQGRERLGQFAARHRIEIGRRLVKYRISGSQASTVASAAADADHRRDARGCGRRVRSSTRFPAQPEPARPARHQ